MASAQDIAAWMLAELHRDGTLYQEVVVYQIAERFGDQHTYHNANGNLAINPDILSAFRKLSGDDVVWSRSERYWRRRQEGDLPGRQQPYS